VKVAIDEQIFAIQRVGGISRYFAELSQQFLENPELGVDLFSRPTPVFNDYLISGLHGRPAMPGVYPSGHLNAMARMMLRRRHRDPVDVVHHTFYLPRFLRDFPGARRVVTVYDMIPERFPGSLRRQDLLTAKRRFVDRADEIVCISNATRNDLAHFYGELNAPVSVIHLGVDFDFFNGTNHAIAGWPESYLLFVGKRSQYKDAATLRSAFGRLAARFPDLHLVFVGGGPFESDEVKEITRLGIGARVRQVHLPDSMMPAAYAHARAFVFPSQYEGFGLPALEAMASGTPTILCRAASLPEVGGDAALYFDPGDPDDLAQAIESVVVDPELAARLTARGFDHARAFTWMGTAKLTASAYADRFR
jgi:glycosyltransferase involved in cell wall biosynthesis